MTKEIVIKSDLSWMASIWLVVYGNETNHFYRVSFVSLNGANKQADFLRKKYKFVEVSELNLFND